MPRNIFKKSISIILCFFLLNLVVYGNTSSGVKKGDQICMDQSNIGSLFSAVFGLELAEETIPENTENSSKNRSQLSEEEVHSLFVHSSGLCFKAHFADNVLALSETNSHLSTHILEINPPPPKV